MESGRKKGKITRIVREEWENWFWESMYWWNVVVWRMSFWRIWRRRTMDDTCACPSDMPATVHSTLTCLHINLLKTTSPTLRWDVYSASPSGTHCPRSYSETLASYSELGCLIWPPLSGNNDMTDASVVWGCSVTTEKKCVCCYCCYFARSSGGKQTHAQSVCRRAYLPNHTCNLFQFLCMLPIAVARSSSGGVIWKSWLRDAHGLTQLRLEMTVKIMHLHQTKVRLYRA